jgi:phospholipid-binding lipoprotein MlaA
MKTVLPVFLLCLALCGGAQAEETNFLDDSFYDDAPDAEAAPDPFEHFNRLMFEINDVTYTWVMEPVASVYSRTLPEDIRQAADNFCYNLQEPVRFVNSLLQFRFADAGTVLTRFVVNTLGGLGGLGDVAGREFGFEKVEAGLGETLETWGVPDGFYLVAPLLGATTARELTGATLDGLAMTPYYFMADTWQESTLIYVGRRVNNLSLRLGEYEGAKEMTIDPYVAFRDGYFQYRKRSRKHSTPRADEKL